MGFVAVLNLCAATAMEYAVNNRALVPEGLNLVCHLVFFVTLVSWCGLLLVYLLMLIERTGGVSQRVLIMTSCVICLLVVCAELVLPLDYVDTSHGSHSSGPKVYVLYAMVMFTIVTLAVLLVRHRATLGHANGMVFAASLVVLVVALAVQMAWPHVFVTSPALVMVMIGLMVTMEDARLYVSPKTGLYNFLACSTILQEKVADSDEIELGCYLFFGEESDAIYKS